MINLSDELVTFIGNYLEFTALAKWSLTGNTDITQETIEALAQYSSELRDIDVSGCDNLDTNIDKSIASLARNCKKLESLRLYETGITDSVIEVITECCQNLQCIELTECEGITPAAMETLAIPFDMLDVKANDTLPTFLQAKYIVRADFVDVPPLPC